jgi:hypothetical protein
MHMQKKREKIFLCHYVDVLSYILPALDATLSSVDFFPTSSFERKKTCFRYPAAVSAHLPRQCGACQGRFVAKTGDL